MAWADSLHFPHVRPAHAGQITVFESMQHYVEAFNFDRVIATGWDHSEWDYKHALHFSSKKVHVAGQWSRYTTTGEKLLSTPIVYIVTYQQGQWGIQSRFSSDYVSDDMDNGITTEMETRCFALIHDFINRANEGNHAACAELINYPHFAIGKDKLDCSKDGSELDLPSGHITVNSLYAIQTGMHSMNAALDINLNIGGTHHQRHIVLNISKRNNHLGIQAWSALDPTVKQVTA